MKPCQRPSQKPATTSCSLAFPLNWLAPGAHPARMFNNSKKSTNTVREDFIGISTSLVTHRGDEQSRKGLSPLLQRSRSSRIDESMLDLRYLRQPTDTNPLRQVIRFAMFEVALDLTRPNQAFVCER